MKKLFFLSTLVCLVSLTASEEVEPINNLEQSLVDFDADYLFDGSLDSGQLTCEGSEFQVDPEEGVALRAVEETAQASIALD